jgi:hypothetical protein
VTSHPGFDVLLAESQQPAETDAGQVTPGCPSADSVGLDGKKCRDLLVRQQPAELWARIPFCHGSNLHRCIAQMRASPLWSGD